MKKTTFWGTEFRGQPLYQPQQDYADKAAAGFDLATLQRIDALIRHALNQSRDGKILAFGLTLAYPAEIDTAGTDNSIIQDFTMRYVRRLRERFNLTVDFLQVRELAPRTGRLHHHCIFMIGGGWWHFVDYQTVRECWRLALERWFGWTGTAAEVPVQIVDNWNGNGSPAYGLPVDGSRPEQVAELFRRMSYLAKNYSRDLMPGVRSFTSSEIR